ncbi:MAG: hypothetical protein PVH52_01830 [bacterium]|jgi:hypothetical protein
MRLPDAAIAGKVLMGLLALLIVMHVLLLARVIPYDVVWGGNITDESQFYVFEISALILNALFLLIAAIKLGYMGAPRLKRAADIGIWIVFAYFAMNIIGNLTAKSSWEKVIFIPLSIVLALLSLRVAAHREAP